MSDEEEFAVQPLGYSDDDDDDDDIGGATVAPWCDAGASDSDDDKEEEDEAADQHVPPSLSCAYEVACESAVDPAYRLLRWDCRFLSVAAFRDSIATTKHPIILTGLGQHVAPRGLGLERVKALLPADLAVPVRGMDGRWNADKFFERLEAGDPVYLADAPIARLCPWLLKEVKVPRYFLHCFTHRTRTPLALVYETPALFVGAAGTCSSMHSARAPDGASNSLLREFMLRAGAHLRVVRTTLVHAS